jgi:hypothetical protein
VVSAVSKWSSGNFENYIGARTMDQQESRVYTVNQKETTRGSRNITINVISPICFHLNCMGSGNHDISSEEHFENSKTRKGTYLLLEL